MKNNFFELGKQELYNKDKYLKNYLDCMYTKTNEIFIYENMPKEIDIKKFEYFLQKNGFIFFTKDGEKFVFYNGSLTDFDIYDEPLQINAIMYNRSVKSFNLENDGVLIKNDFLLRGLNHIFNKYGVMLCESEITLYLSSITNRIQYLISATDDKTKQSAESFLNKIYSGDFSIIGSNAFFDGIEVNALNQAQNSTINNIELCQYIKASAFNEIGLNSNFNLKRERLTATEINVNENSIKPFILDMLDCRKKCIDKINEMYNLNIQVHLSSLWDNYTPQEETTEETNEETTEETNEEVEEVKDIEETDTQV